MAIFAQFLLFPESGQVVGRRKIRGNTDIDTGLMFRDMEAKIRLAAKKEHCLNNSANN